MTKRLAPSSIHRQIIEEYMRKQLIKFNMPTDSVKLSVDLDNDINTIVEGLEEVCVKVEINDKVEEFIKQVNTNDDIIATLATCAEKLFERNNRGRVIVFISFVGQLIVHYVSKAEIECANLILEWLISYFETQLDAEGKNVWRTLKEIKRNNNWLICVVAGVILGVALLFSSKMTNRYT